ncbi:MAG: N-acetyltransferase family protein [Bacillota bacterium]
MNRGKAVSELLIRPYHPGDLPFMAQGAAFNAWDLVPEPERTPDAWMRAARFSYGNLMNMLRQPGGTALILEEDGGPVAFILLGIGPDTYTGQLYGYLGDIFVTPEYRRRGLSLLLHREAEQYFRSQGVRQAKLWIGAENRAALESARKAGFQPEGHVLWKRYAEPSG